MKVLNTPEIKNNVFYVGVKDWNRRLFDALIPLPQGTTYNSYLIKGQEKTALIDTVNPGFEKDLESRINNVSNVSQIDYVIMNHAEPDHAGSIPYILSVNSKANLVTSKIGAQAAKIYFNVPEDRLMIVKDNDTLELGGKRYSLSRPRWFNGLKPCSPIYSKISCFLHATSRIAYCLWLLRRRSSGNRSFCATVFWRNHDALQKFRFTCYGENQEFRC